MKKIIVLFLIIIMVFSTGCPGPESESKNNNDSNKVQSEDNIDMKASRQFIENYMRYVIKRDAGAMKSFYSTKIKSEIRDLPAVSNPHPVGYKIEEGENKETNAEFKAHIYNSYTGKPYYSDDTFKYTITMDNGKMVIDKIEKENTIEVFEKEKALYKREGDKARGELVVSLQDLPYYVVPRGSLSPEQKFPVPRKAFGPCAISPDGKSMIITSVGEQTLVALVKQDQEEDKAAMSTQGEDKQGGGGGGGEGGGGEGEGQQGEAKGQEEKGQAATVKSIDFYFEGKVVLVSYSPDGKTFVIEQTMPNGLNQVLLYESEKGEPVNHKITTRFRKDTFSITNPYFVSEDNLAFTVEPVSSATREEQKLKGDYIINLKTQKLTQIQ
jgi:hypothetical protein